MVERRGLKDPYNDLCSDVLVKGPWSEESGKRDISYEWVAKMEDIQKIEDGIPIIEFAEKIARRNFEMEFRLLRRITETQYHNDILQEFDPQNNKLNRYKTILPYKQTEVTIVDQEEESINYINASFINSVYAGSEGQKKFIATQGPLPHTLNHFWRMVWHYDVRAVIMLCNLKENDKVQCDQYWPKFVGDSLDFGRLSVTLESEELLDECLCKRTLRLTYNHTSDGESTQQQRIVVQYQLSAWRDHGVPDTEKMHVVDIVVEVMIAEHQQKRISVVHCSAGVGRTGTLIALVNLHLQLLHNLPQISAAFANNEKKYSPLSECTISVFGVVRRIREQRWGMVQQAEQYIFIYNHLKNSIEEHLQRLRSQ